MTWPTLLLALAWMASVRASGAGAPEKLRRETQARREREVLP